MPVSVVPESNGRSSGGFGLFVVEDCLRWWRRGSVSS